MRLTVSSNILKCDIVVSGGGDTIVRQAQSSSVSVEIGSGGVPGSGGDKNNVHRQDQASSEWIINHDLEKFPSVSVVDSAGDAIIGKIHYESNKKIILKFSAPLSGRAFLN